MNSGNGNNGNGNNGNGNNGNGNNGNNYSRVTNNGTLIHVRPIPREGSSNPVSRRKRPFKASFNAYLSYASFANKINARRKKTERNRKRNILTAYRELKESRKPKNTRRGPKGAKLT